jgi:hypothetical protein
MAYKSPVMKVILKSVMEAVQLPFSLIIKSPVKQGSSSTIFVEAVPSSLGSCGMLTFTSVRLQVPTTNGVAVESVAPSSDEHETNAIDRDNPRIYFKYFIEKFW